MVRTRSMRRAQTDPSYMVATELGGKAIPGVSTGPEVIDVDAISSAGATTEPMATEGASETPDDNPPGPGWVPVSHPRATAFRSSQSPIQPCYCSRLSFDDLKLLEFDLVAARQALDRLSWLHQEYQRKWTGKWWGASDRWTLEVKYSVQLRQFRMAVAAGAVTASQRSSLLSRVDA